MSDGKGTFENLGPDGTQDPSMDEILASIRRILSEEQGGPKFQQESGNELLLDSTMLVSVPGGFSMEPVVNVAFPLPIQNSPPEFEQTYNGVNQMQPLGTFTDAGGESQKPYPAAPSFQTIEPEAAVAVGRPAITLEDMVGEALKPLLKTWLDENLPTLVERVVRAEMSRYPRSEGT